MSEQVKGVIAAIVIVACLGFLAYLVHEKTEGAVVVGLGVVPVLIAYFTRAPEKKDPPAGAGIVLLAAFAAVLSACACTPFWSATELLARKAQCALAHRDLSNEQILLECAIDPKDAKNIFDIVSQERAHDVAMAKAARCQ